MSLPLSEADELSGLIAECRETVWKGRGDIPIQSDFAVQVQKLAANAERIRANGGLMNRELEQFKCDKAFEELANR